MRLILTTCLCLMGLPAMAGIEAVISDHIMVRQAAFSATTQRLADAAQTDCTPAGMIPAYHAAFDAWVGVSHIRFGPIEDDGEALAVAFWPDKKGMIPKNLTRIIGDEDPIVYDAAAFANTTIATRGFFALEQVLFEPKFADYATGSYTCALTQAITRDLARIGAQTLVGWQGGFADILRDAGGDGNSVYLTEKEGAQALFTNMLAGLEYIHSQRLGRPVGSFERPRPRRAEARRSGRSLRNIIVSLEALQEMAGLLSDGQASETMEAFAATLRYTNTLDDHVFEQLSETSAKFQLTSLQVMVAGIHEAATAEIGGHLGVVAGFNALDGD